MIETLFRRFCIYEEEYIKVLNELESLLPDKIEVDDILDFKNISSWEYKKLVDVDFNEKYSSVLVSNSKTALYVKVPTNILLAGNDDNSRKYARGAAALELISHTIENTPDHAIKNLLFDKLRDEYNSFLEFKRKLSEGDVNG